MSLRCMDCGETVDLRTALVEVSGFVKQRSAGGANHILFREETGRVLCDKCSVRRRYGGTPMQLAFDGRDVPWEDAK